MGIVVVGTVFVDIKGFPDSVYVEGGRNAGRIEEVHGGVARNVVENIANVELRPVFLSLVDESGAAGAVITKLNKHMVNTEYVKATPDGMGTWLAIFDHTGEVVANLSKRPNLLPMVDIIREHGDEIFKDCDSIAIEIDIDKEVVKEVFNFANKYDKKVYSLISSMTIALERKDYIRESECFVCNESEAAIFFGEDLENITPEEMANILVKRVKAANMKSMIVTMAEKGAAYADADGNFGTCLAKKTSVVDTTGAGDAFFSGACIGLTYGKSMAESCEIGARIAASVICTTENTCPRFMPQELGIEV